MAEGHDQVKGRPRSIEHRARGRPAHRLADGIELAHRLGGGRFALFHLGPRHQAIEDFSRKETVEAQGCTHQDT